MQGKDIITEYLEPAAEKRGWVEKNLNLYPNQEQNLLIEGFSIQRLSCVNGYPGEHTCKIGWKYAVEGTRAYELLMKAAEVKPELLQHDDEPDSPVPPPYTSGGGWDEV